MIVSSTSVHFQRKRPVWSKDLQNTGNKNISCKCVFNKIQTFFGSINAINDWRIVLFHKARKQSTSFNANNFTDVTATYATAEVWGKRPVEQRRNSQNTCKTKDDLDDTEDDSGTSAEMRTTEKKLRIVLRQLKYAIRSVSTQPHSINRITPVYQTLFTDELHAQLAAFLQQSGRLIRGSLYSVSHHSAPSVRHNERVSVQR
jgi:uncharacterized iron-regulated membrane protein